MIATAAARLPTVWMLNDVDGCPGPCQGKAGHFDDNDAPREAPVQCSKQIAKPRHVTWNTIFHCLNCLQLKGDGQGGLANLPQNLEEQRKQHKTPGEASKGIQFSVVYINLESLGCVHVWIQHHVSGHLHQNVSHLVCHCDMPRLARDAITNGQLMVFGQLNAIRPIFGPISPRFLPGISEQTWRCPCCFWAAAK